MPRLKVEDILYRATNCGNCLCKNGESNGCPYGAENLTDCEARLMEDITTALSSVASILDNHTPEKIAELTKADKEGRLLILPVNKGFGLNVKLRVSPKLKIQRRCKPCKNTPVN